MNEIHDKIFELENSLLNKEVRNSPEQLDILLADDFLEYGSSGLIYNKQDIIARLPASTDDIIYTMSDFEIKVLSGDVIMANFKTDKIINGTEKKSSLRTSLWRKEGDTWKIFFHQGTIINKL